LSVAPLAPVPAPTPRGFRRVRLAELPLPVLVGAAVAVVAVGLLGLASGAEGPTAVPIATPAVFAIAFTPLGVFVLRRLPGHPLGRLMSAAGVFAAASALTVCWSDLLPMAWLSQWTWWPPLATVPVLLLLVPDGALPSPRWRVLLWSIIAAASLATAALAVAAVARPRTLFEQRTIAAPELRPLLSIALGAIGVVLLGTLAVFVALFVRWRRAGPRERGQLACLAPAAVALAVGLTVETVFGVPVAWIVAVAALPLGLTLAVLRYQLHDLDLYVNRGVVWLTLTTLAIGTYAVAVTALGRVVGDAGSPVPSLLAAAAVAALLQPASRLAQRGVNRLLYGRRDEPYAVLTQLGGHLEAVRDPLAVLPQIAATLVDGLRLPYVAIRVAGEDGAPVTAAEHGRWSGEPHRFAMVAHGRPVGELWVAPRRSDSHFTGTESRLLHDLAGQTALAAEAVRSSVRLQRARDRLVLAREEERRRLRRDLHDGVAAALVGVRMLTAVLRRSVAAEGTSTALVDTLSADLDVAIVEVRSLIDGLGPAALDDGLRIALEGLADRLGGHGANVTLTVTGSLAGLPAAVEVAAYRIVAECLTNTMKHAEAANCAIAVRRDPAELEISVADDGKGMPAELGDPVGVGLSSIRERAEELGGQTTVTSAQGGTRTWIRLPLEPEPVTPVADPLSPPRSDTGPASDRSAL
jgi:signal transduction histidine kinase